MKICHFVFHRSQSVTGLEQHEAAEMINQHFPGYIPLIILEMHLLV